MAVRKSAVENMGINATFWQGKKVFITGHTGFKGGWLSLWLTHLGAKVVGVSKDVPTTPSNFIASCLTDKIDDRRVDILDLESMKGVMQEMQPDFVFHLAAQALVRPAYSNPLNTITTNSIGTANILESVRMLKKEVTLVMITSDKAYDNVEWVWGYRETDRLGGKDPYSASKASAELAIQSYISSFFPLEKLLVETDSPFLAPLPYRGKFNEPSYIVHTVEKLSKIKKFKCS